MHKLVKLCLAISLILSTGIGLIAIIGRKISAPTQLSLLHFDDCNLPCWINIIPGKTTLAEAKQRVIEKYSNSNYIIEFYVYMWQFKIIDQENGISLNVHLNELINQPADTVVDSILISWDNTLSVGLTYGELQNALELPTDIILSSPDDTPYPILRYERQQIHVGLDATMYKNQCSRLTKEQPVNFIVIYNQLPKLNEYAWVSDPEKWRGFRTCYYFTRRNSSLP